MTDRETKPVAWCYTPDMEWLNQAQITSRSIPVWLKPIDHYETPLYLRPSRKAVRLSDEEIDEIWRHPPPEFDDLVRAIEAAVLKKNGLEAKI